MKCARVQKLFSSYAENAMEPPLRVAFEQHLAECDECRARYTKFNATMLLLEEMPEVEVPAGFHAAVMARVERSRNVKPQAVKWWHLDWQRVFTVQVPARALAMGLAVMLLMVMVVQLTPLSSTVASFLPQRPGANAPIGEDDLNAPQIGESAPNICYNVPKSGLSVCVDTSALSTDQGSYALSFEATSSEAVKFGVYMIPADAASPEAQGRLFYSGFVYSKRGATVGVPAGQTSVVRIDWQQDGRTYRQYVFLPSHFSTLAKNMDLTVSASNIYGALRQVCESYGVVVVASGDLSKGVNYVGGESQAPADALFGIVQSSNLKWSGVSTGVYAVQPRQ